jgi:hypothetical protein
MAAGGALERGAQLPAKRVQNEGVKAELVPLKLVLRLNQHRLPLHCRVFCRIRRFDLANIKYQIPNSKQQTAHSKQQTANSK